MKSIFRYCLLAVNLVLCFGFLRSSKSQLVTPDVEFVVTGSSTVNEWKMVSKTAVGKAQVDIADGRLTHIRDLRIDLPVKSLKSGTSRMEEDAYNALKAEKYPTILFCLSDLHATQTTGNIIHFAGVGELTLAGVTRKVQVNAASSMEKDKLTFSGTAQLKLSNFDVTPPTAMFGLIKSNDDVSVGFKMIF